MELKKNPKIDIYQYRPLIFQINLIILLTLVITAFEWRSPDLFDGFDMNDSSNQVPVQLDPLPPMPKPTQTPNSIHSIDLPEQSEGEEDTEILIEVELDIALEGRGSDNSFLDQMQPSRS